MRIRALLVLFLPVVCARGAFAQKHTFDIIADRTYDPSVAGGWLKSAHELTDGRIVVADAYHNAVVLVGTDGRLLSRYVGNPPAVAKLVSVTDAGLAADGSVLVLDGRRSIIHLLHVTASSLEYVRTIPTGMTGQTMGMCVTGNRIFVIGSRDANDSTVLHEIDWTGVVRSSFAKPVGKNVEELRMMRLSQISCAPNRIVLAPPGDGNLYFFDYNGARQGVMAVPGHDEILYTRTRDPTEPKLRRNEWNEWNTVHYAPDGLLVVQYDHYIVNKLDRTITQTFDEIAGWTWKSSTVPKLVTIGLNHAYAVSGSSQRLARYRFKSK